MYKITIILILVMLTGCAPEPAPDPDSGYSYTTTTTDSGITVGYSDDSQLLYLTTVDDYYQLISNCAVGEYITPNFKIYTQGTMPRNGGVEVAGISKLYTDRVPEIYIYYPNGMRQGVALSIMLHEMVHIVLLSIGEPMSSNINHESPAFQCAF